MAGLSAFTPQPTLVGYEQRRADLYRDLLHICMRNTQIRVRLEPYVMHPDIMTEVERRVITGAGGGVPLYSGGAPTPQTPATLVEAGPSTPDVC